MDASAEDRHGRRCSGLGVHKGQFVENALRETPQGPAHIALDTQALGGRTGECNATRPGNGPVVLLRGGFGGKRGYQPDNFLRTVLHREMAASLQHMQP